MADATIDLPRAHRWFAVECNNEAWELVERPARTADENDLMIHLAHAAYWHWLHAGEALNRLRALCLLATACNAAERRAEGRRYGEEALRLLDEISAKATPFDRASVLGCAGEHAAFLEALRAISDHDERALLERLYG